MEKSNIEILKEFAKSTHRRIYTDETPYPKTGIRTFQKFKRQIYMPINTDDGCHFIWYSDAYGEIGRSRIFCGAFIPLASKINGQLNIRSKNALDHVNVFSKNNKNKIGHAKFDAKAILSEEVDSNTKRLLSRAKIQEQILKALDLSTNTILSLNEYNIDFAPAFKNKSYLAIINPQKWEMETSHIEEMIRIAEKIRNAIY